MTDKTPTDGWRLNEDDRMARQDLADARADRVRIERLLTALKRIATFQPDTSHDDSVVEAIRAQIEGCADCAAVQERKWPPTGMCDHHFSKMYDVKRWQDRTAASGKYDMKTIAVQALMDWELTS